MYVQVNHGDKGKMDDSKMFAPEPVGDASQCEWFWQNYYNGLKWSERHQIAYWRSRSVALEYENMLLHGYVKNLLDGARSKARPSTSARKRGYYCNGRKQKPQRVNATEPESEEKFEVSNEMMEFFKISIMHKMEREKQKKEEEKNKNKNESFGDEEMVPAPLEKQVGLERIEDMHRIYGKAAPMIIGMETAMQLTFDRNCDIHQPKFWPNIPLNM